MAGPSVESSMTILREDMFNIIKQCKVKNIDKKLDFLEGKLTEMTKCPNDKINLLRDSLKSFRHHYKSKWTAASYKEDRFCKTNEQWLKGTISLPDWRLHKPGRPSKEFQECSDRSKRRKTEHVRSEVPHDELTYAAVMSERAAGNNDLSKLIQQASVTPTRATKFRKIISSAEKCSKSGQLTVTKALMKYVEADLTRKQYNVIRSGQEDIYPCYSLLQRAKKECYPKDVIVSEVKAEATVQNLLDHTGERLCLYLEEVLMTATETEMQNMTLISKWGCDGSKAQEFKQMFENQSDSDAHVFISSLVPLRLTSNVNGTQKVWWQNPAPSSSRFCRPITIQFVHESTEVIRLEIEYIENQQRNIIPTKVEINDKLIKVSHTLLLTMVDGKVCNAATSTTSTMKCYICKQSSKDFNSLKRIDESAIDPNTLKFGLSILHTRIRFLEMCLHMAYKLPIGKWRLSSEEKIISNAKKKEIQEAFKNELGLLVDVPKAGFGNTNDGNTSRRFFADPEITARITGLNIEFLKNLKVILEVLASGFRIDTEKFSQYLRSTAELYVHLYKWHPMTPTLHKILCHGALVIEHALLPIGQLSEEAAESRNKHFRLYRQNFARKFSRKDCLQDVMNRLLLTSDVFLSCSSRAILKRIRKPFSSEALSFLKADEYQCSVSTNTVDESGESDDADDY